MIFAEEEYGCFKARGCRRIGVTEVQAKVRTHT